MKTEDQNKPREQPNWGKGRSKGSFDATAYDLQGYSTIRLSQSDVDQLRTIGEFLNCNKSEAVRTSIRVYAALVAQMKKQS